MASWGASAAALAPLSIAAAGSARAAGIVTVKMVPSSRLDRTPIAPPWAVTIRSAMNNPSPSP